MNTEKKSAVPLLVCLPLLALLFYSAYRIWDIHKQAMNLEASILLEEQRIEKSLLRQLDERETWLDKTPCEAKTLLMGEGIPVSDIVPAVPQSGKEKGGAI
ncbi:MAG: hypothetical protein J5828_06315 [Desulfovibrionaceae bacterium]|nr:hypothetical protein [Desulfovibrionaceae bacterium]